MVNVVRLWFPCTANPSFCGWLTRGPNSDLVAALSLWYVVKKASSGQKQFYYTSSDFRTSLIHKCYISWCKPNIN